MGELGFYGWLSIGLAVAGALVCLQDRRSCATWDRVLCTAMVALMGCWMTTGLPALCRYSAAALLAGGCLWSFRRVVQEPGVVASDLLLTTHRVSGGLLMVALLLGLATSEMAANPSQTGPPDMATMSHHAAAAAMNMSHTAPTHDPLLFAVGLTYALVGGAAALAMFALGRRWRCVEAALMTSGMALMVFVGLS